MILYHGTSYRYAEAILRDGLKPRGEKGRSHYKAKSHPDAVYLTDAYAPYFAFNTKEPINHGCVVFAIDTTRLNMGNLAPDEDALEQANRHLGFADIKGDMAQRTRYFLRRHFEFAAQGYDWAWSLKALGTCCYHGVIPPSAIVKTIEWTDRATTMQMILGAFDPTITLANYRFMGAEYRFLMQELAQVDSGHPIPAGRIIPERLAAIRALFAKVTIHNLTTDR